jgi:hypothetical protein
MKEQLAIQLPSVRSQGSNLTHRAALLAGEVKDLEVSVARDIGQNPAATLTADPVEEPRGASETLITAFVPSKCDLPILLFAFLPF